MPVSHEILNRAELLEEAGRCIGSLLSLTASPALSRFAKVFVCVVAKGYLLGTEFGKYP